MKHLKTTLKWVLPSVKIAYKMLAITGEVFCRHSFGRRYAPILLASFFSSWMALSLFRHVVPQPFPALIDIYLLCFFVLIVYHIARMWRPRPTIHSYSSGQSWALWSRHNINSNIVRLLIEPLIMVLVGLLLVPANGLLSLWLQLGGVCLFIKELLSYWQFRNRVFDSIDARLEGERIGTGVRQQTAPRGAREQRINPVVAAEPAQPPANSIQQIYSRLDPALQQLVATPNQHRSAAPRVVIRHQGRMPRTRPGVAATQPQRIPQPQGPNAPPLARVPNPIAPRRTAH
jgi:hypothetical protein